MPCGSSCGCDQPDDPAPSPSPENASAFPFRAASWSLVSACAVIALLRISASQFRKGETGETLGLLAETGGGVVAAVGLTLAVIALANVNKLGPDGLLGKGALGIMLNGGFMLIIATNLIAGRERDVPDRSPQQPNPIQPQAQTPPSNTP